MARYLTNKETQAALERIIINSEKKLILVSPYIKLTNSMFARIGSAADKGVLVKVMYRVDKVDNKELNRLKELKNIELKCTADLHAKCYFNEKEMIITSLNLLETSEKNWEMGIYVSRINDKEMYEAALFDVLTIFADSKSEKTKMLSAVNKVQSDYKKVINKPSSQGYCIRCSVSLPFKTSKPYCSNCFASWSFWENYDFEEKSCHLCGKDWNTTMAKSLCYTCFKEQN